MKNLYRYCLVFFLLNFLPQSSVAIKHDHPEVKTFKEILTHHKKDKKKIIQRYGEKSEIDTNLSKRLIKDINTFGLAPIIDKLILHKTIILYDIDELVLFAKQIRTSGLPYEDLEWRITKYIKQGEKNREALARAIEKEQAHKYKEEKIKRLVKNKDNFINAITKLQLKERQKEKIFDAYAICIQGFYDDHLRSTMLRPKFGVTLDKFNEPQCKSGCKRLKRRSPMKKNDKFFAYQALIGEGKKVAHDLSLNDFDKILMAKCIAERSIYFFTPKRSPVKAFIRHTENKLRSPTSIYFIDKGVCSNFSVVTYNISKNLGIKGELYVTRRKLHTYLEAKIDGKWYHVHPFWGTSYSSDFNPF